MFAFTLSVVFVIVIAIQFIYLLLFNAKMATNPKKESEIYHIRENSERDITVIICAKNEAENLRTCLPKVLEQEYCTIDGEVAFEVIVVNDGSTDDTLEVLKGLKERFANLKTITLPASIKRTLPGKKFALSWAVQSATTEKLLFTDADCIPSSLAWLKLMVAPLAQGKEIVAGYGGFMVAPIILNRLIRCETLHTFIQYCSYQRIGVPYMAVGRNLACTKKVFTKAERNPNWAAFPSGDDDLLVRYGATRSNMSVVYSPVASTISYPKNTWGGWLKQKQRHVSTGKLYKPGIKILLGLYAISHAFTWLLITLMCIFYPFNRIFILLVSAFILRIVLFHFVMRKTALVLNEKQLGFFIIFFDLFWLFYNVLLSPYIIWKNKLQWK